MLHVLSKLIEKIIKSKASKFITDNIILYRNQFGFRSGCSTSDAILHFTDDCVTGLDNRLSTIAIFWTSVRLLIRYTKTLCWTN